MIPKVYFLDFRESVPGLEDLKKTTNFSTAAGLVV